MDSGKGAPRLAAVVDLGTNAARLAVAELDSSGALVSRGRWRELIRLGEGVASSGALSEAAMARGIETLERFRNIAEEMGVDIIEAVATSVLREASNGEAFAREVRKLGVPLRVISGEEEARLSLAGVISTRAQWPAGRSGERPDRKPDERANESLVFDIGGGSLELTHEKEGKMLKTCSLNAGVVYLTEGHLRDIPTPKAQVEACARDMSDMLHSMPLAPPDVPLIGCGGTVALAGFVREEKDRNQGINGVFIERGEIGSWVDRFAALDMTGRNLLPGFEPGREDIALAGLIVVREILRWGGYETLRVSTGGVREGLLKRLLLRE
ncbi:MAG: hypothetical protein HOJ95_08485 [Nitrospinaceae bacterium]|nr:hypothetical protein [Nitrospinaceae bacterium]